MLINAFFKSRKTIVLECPLSMLNAQLSVASEKAVTVKCTERLLFRNNILFAPKLYSWVYTIRLNALATTEISTLELDVYCLGQNLLEWTTQ